MSARAAAREGAPITAWNHARAIALLPFLNTVVIPSLLLTVFPPVLPSAWHAVTVTTTATGVAVLASGATLVVHTIRLFMRHGRGTLAPWDPTRELVSVGAYRFSRNPMKAGLFLVLAGEALLVQSTALAAWFVCFAIVNVVYIRLHEEPGLRRRFGERYGDYCARVPRWWPALGSLRALTNVAKETAR